MILGVTEDASHDEVIQAYRSQAWLFHPDRLVGATDADLVTAHSAMARLNEAKATLGQHRHPGRLPARRGRLMSEFSALLCDVRGWELDGILRVEEFATKRLLVFVSHDRDAHGAALFDEVLTLAPGHSTARGRLNLLDGRHVIVSGGSEEADRLLDLLLGAGPKGARSRRRRGASWLSRKNVTVVLLCLGLLAGISSAAILSQRNTAPPAASESTTASTLPPDETASSESRDVGPDPSEVIETTDETSQAGVTLEPPQAVIQGRSGETQIYDSVTWESVKVEGPDPEREVEINSLLSGFTNELPEEYLASVGGLNGSTDDVRGYYEAKIEQIACDNPYLCFVQRGAFLPPGGVSSFFFIDTIVVDYESPRIVTVEDFVEPRQLGTLVTLTERAIVSTDELNQTGPIDLEASYDQFRNAIPFDEGLLIYFSEQSVGSLPSEVYVPWGRSGDRPTVVDQRDNSMTDTITYICGRAPESLPPLVGADSDSRATRALQVALLNAFGEDPGPIDGQYGPRTIAATKRMQSSLGVVPDGQVGPITWQAMQSRLCPGG